MKTVFKIIDSQGRIVIPLEMREAIDVQKGDILELQVVENRIQIEKLDVVKLNDESLESMKNTVISTAKKLDRQNLLTLAKRLVEMAEKKEEENG